MTSGTKTYDRRWTEIRYSRQRYTGVSPPEGIYGTSGTSLVGNYSKKTWSGDDTPVPPSRPKGKKRYYTVLDSRGRVRTKSFYERLPKRSQFRSPTEYDVNAEMENHPIGSFVSSVTNQVTGNFSEQTYTNCSSVGAGCAFAFHSIPAWTSNDDIKLIGKLREEVYGSDFNAAVFLGEGSQTFKLIGDSAIKIVTAIGQFRKGNVLGAAKTLVAGRRLSPKTKRAHAGSNWLELQYGWLPLLKDIQEAGQMAAYHLSSPMRRRYQVRSTKKVVSPSGNGQNWEYGDSYTAYQKQIIAYISEPPGFAEYSGLMDPELVAWELIPFSFVADWVAPLGDWMKARSFAGRTVGLYVTTTKQTYYCGGLRRKPYVSGNDIYNFQNSTSSERKVTVVSRRLSNNLSVPLPKVKPLEKIASWQHCANALALLSVASKHVSKQSFEPWMLHK